VTTWQIAHLSMPRVIVVFPADKARAPVEIAAPNGGSLADLCDEHAAPIPFACRDANCGACRVEVLEGASELCDADPDEARLLAVFAAPPTHRLACRAQMKPGLATLRLRAVTR
jgi:ferredoxin